jgi:hypothetical protein
VLARLEEEDVIDAAEVDRRGELIRLALRSTEEVPQVEKLLRRLGFASEVAVETAVGDRRWYPREAVGELSREEGEVIAQRVVPDFARLNGLATEDGAEIRRLVAAALHKCFVTNVLDATAPASSLHGPCGRAVEQTTRQRIGPARAAALGRAIEADLLDVKHRRRPAECPPTTPSGY